MIRFAALLALLLCLGPAAAQATRSLEMLRGEETGIVPRYLLQDPNGRAVSSEDFHGRYQLIAFGYTYCPDICPTTLVEMAEILKQLGEQAGLVQPIFISVDPERDTGKVLKTYTEFFDARILGLTAPPALLRRTADNFKIRYAKVRSADKDPQHYAIDHSAGMFLLGPDGGFIKKFAFATPVVDISRRISEIIKNRQAM